MALEGFFTHNGQKQSSILVKYLGESIVEEIFGEKFIRTLPTTLLQILRKVILNCQILSKVSQIQMTISRGTLTHAR